MGDKLLLNLGAKFPILIYYLTCEIIKLSWQLSVRVSAKMSAKF